MLQIEQSKKSVSEWSIWNIEKKKHDNNLSYQCFGLRHDKYISGSKTPAAL